MNQIKILPINTKLYTVSLQEELPRIWFLNKGKALLWGVLLFSSESNFNSYVLKEIISKINMEYINKELDKKLLDNPQVKAKKAVLTVKIQSNLNDQRIEDIALGFSDTSMINNINEYTIDWARILSILTLIQKNKSISDIKSYFSENPNVFDSYLTPIKLENNQVIAIEGPISLREWKIPHLDKHIYLFGDRHERKLNCPDNVTKKMHIVDVVENSILSNPSKTIDIFMEVTQASKIKLLQDLRQKTQFLSYDNPAKSNYMSDMRHKYENCLQISKEECPYTNARFHYSDVRLSNFLVMWYLMEVHMEYKDEEIEKSLLFAVSKTPKTFSGMIKALKIDKQLNNIKNEPIRNLIISYFEPKIMQLYDNLIILSKMANLRTPSMFNFLGSTAGLFKSSFMDIYTLARIFRSFRKIPGKYSEDPKNIIVYAGEAHTETISEVISMINGSQKIQEVISHDLDINASNLQWIIPNPNTLPLFSN